MIAQAVGRAVDTVLDRTVVGGYTSPGLALRRRLPGWPADPAPGSLRGRHVLVTGATSGLGQATASGLAALGAITHLVVRDEAKGAEVAARLRSDGGDVEVLRCDVGDLDDVRRFAAALPDALGGASVHALVHNAGVMPPERTTSPQGHELSMAVHVLGPVLMSELLRPELAGGRVVLVSSGGMYAQELRADDPDYLRGTYSPTAAYARSKRMQVELAPLLADRWSLDRMTLATMHPGWADTPGVRDSLPGFHKLTAPVLRDEAEGADTSVWLAATEPAPATGLFWHDRRPRPTHLRPGTRPDPVSVKTAWHWLRDTLELGR